MFKSQLAMAFNIFLLLASIYLLFFRGYIITIDETFLFDMTESVVRRGNIDETLTFSHAPLRGPADSTLFSHSESYEPLQPILAAPLFWLGQTVPDFNLIHTVWLFNIIVVALTAVVFAYGVRVQGYDEVVAWSCALLLGLGTLMMPYARTYFREPLMTMFLTVALIAAMKVRTVKGRYPIPEVVIAGVALLLAAFAKSIAITFALPIALLMFRAKRIDWLIIVGGGIAGLIGLVLLEQVGLIASGSRLAPTRWASLINDSELEWVSQSIRGYVYSPGRSFFLYSPILLLSPIGMWLLWNRGDWRLVLSIVGMFVAFAVGYGFLRKNVWHGGVSIGPRYLLPLIPLFMFSISPVIDWLRQHSSRHIMWALFLAVAGVSIGLQLLFSSYSERDYYDSFDQYVDVSAIEEGIWSLRWSPIVRYAEELNADTFDTVWRSGDLWLLIVVGLAIVAVVEIVAALRRLPIPTPVRILFSSGVLVIVVAVGLRSVGDDPRFLPDDREDITQMLAQLPDVADQDDAILLKDLEFFDVFAANYKHADLIITLPGAPGELYSPIHQPLVEDGTTAELAGPYVVGAYDYVAAEHERAWLVTYFGPFHTFARRPEERYLAENYYHFETIEYSDRLRLVGFYLVSVPQDVPEYTSALTFGEQVRLHGYDLPQGNTYQAGDIVPASVLVSATQTIARDYTFSLQIVDSAGVVVAQQDSPPIAGFERTSTWTPDQQWRDARGLVLPADLPTGNYRLQMIVYYWEDGVRLDVVTDDGDIIGDIAILHDIIVE